MSADSTAPEVPDWTEPSLAWVTYLRHAHTGDAVAALDAMREETGRMRFPSEPAILLSDGETVQTYAESNAEEWGGIWMQLPSGLHRDLWRQRMMWLQTESRGAEQAAWDAAHPEDAS